jgi:hypothetical protein
MKERIGTDAAIIRKGLRQTEGAIDDALLETTTLMQVMLRARQNPDLAPHAGQKSIMRLTAAMQQQVRAANNVFRVHDEMSQIGVAFGVIDHSGSTPQSGLGEQPPATTPAARET